MTLTELLDRADDVQNNIWDIIETRMTVTDHRFQILLGYLSLALEHQKSIVTLVRNNHNGSALALVRPVFEILYRMLWTAQIANESQTQQIWEGTFAFPSVGNMASDLESAVSGGEMLQTMKKLSWEFLNDYTHSGGFQIRSRFGDGYSKDEVIANVKVVTLTVLVIAVAILEKYNRPQDAERLGVLIPMFNE